MSFTSAQLAGMSSLVFRLRATDYDGTVADGDKPTAFLAGGSLAKTLTHATANGPIFKKNIINGKSVFRFVSANTDYFTISGGGITLAADYTIIVVYKTAAANSRMLVLGHSTVNENLTYDFPADGTKAWSVFQGGLNPASSTLAATSTTANSMTLTRTGGLLQFREAGVSRYHGQIETTSVAWEIIGGGGGGSYIDGDIAELLIFNRTLSIAEEADIAAYVLSEYGITSALAQTTLVYPVTTPTLYTNLSRNYLNELDVTFGSNLDVDLRLWSMADCNPDLATFRTTLTALIGAPSSSIVGYVTLDMEVPNSGATPLPAYVPFSPDLTGVAEFVAPDGAPYNSTQWRTTNVAYINNVLDDAKDRYPNVKFVVYRQPNVRYTQTDNSYASLDARAQYFDAYTQTPLNATTITPLIDTLSHQNGLGPEVYAWDETMTQLAVNTWMTQNVQVNQVVSAYYVKPAVRQEVCVHIWVQGLGGSTTPVGTFLPIPTLTRALIAARLANADKVFILGDRGYYTAAEWQTWVNTSFPQALMKSGFLQPALTSRQRARSRR